MIVVSGNITGKTLTAPVFIFQLTSQFRPEEAAAVATLLFAISFVLVLVTTRSCADKEGAGREARSRQRGGSQRRTPAYLRSVPRSTSGSCWSLPLIGIVWTALKPGLHIVSDTLKEPDVQHALLLTVRSR